MKPVIETAKHTPGPWSTRIAETGGATEIVAATKRGLTKVVARLGGYFRDDRAANASLLSTAPEMLEQLESIVEYAESSGSTASWLPAAKAAIRKAKGNL